MTPNIDRDQAWRERVLTDGIRDALYHIQNGERGHAIIALETALKRAGQRGRES